MTRRISRVALVSEATLLLAPGYQWQNLEYVDIHPVRRAADREVFQRDLQGSEAIVAGPEAYDRELLGLLPDLKLICRSGVGFDQIDVGAADDLGILVTTTPGVTAPFVAEHTLALVLALLHRIPTNDARVRAGGWREGGFFPELRAKTVGIVGFGAIGRCFAELVAPLGAQVVVHDARPIINCPDGVERARSLEDLLTTCDVVSLHVPLTEATRNLIGRTQIALMPRGSFLVNTARGGVVDESALADSLESGHLAGVALDVFAVEPLDMDSPLRRSPNCLFSPHVASFGERSIAEVTSMICTQLSRALRGEVPPGVVNSPLRPRAQTFRP